MASGRDFPYNARVTNAEPAAVPVADLMGILMAGLVGIAMLLLLGAVLAWARRKFHPMYARKPDAGFPMDQMERLRAEGKISDEELEAIRRAALGLTQEKTDSGDSSLRDSPEDDDADERPAGD